MHRISRTLLSILAWIFFTSTTWANELFEGLETIGKPIPGGINFQPPATELAKDLVWLDNMLLVIITLISLLVVGVLAFAVIRYSRKANPNPQTFTHHSALEITWTVVPILILVFIGTFSLPILFKQLEIPESDVTIKATGNQWYWSYEYPEHEFGFDSFMLEKEELEKYGYQEDEYLLATDYPMVVPVDTNIRMQIAGADVIHAWKIPAFSLRSQKII